MFPLSNVIRPATLQEVKNFPYTRFFSKFFLFRSIVFNCMSRDSLITPQVVYKGSSDASVRRNHDVQIYDALVMNSNVDLPSFGDG